jgi:dihydrofolate synthase/folylpolyglutamate synthase
MQADRAFNDLRYGEAWVSLTYLWFAWQEVQWLVMEAGLGGRFDPTNAIDPELAVITNVNFDHLKSLGPDLLDIAYHKAGIIKPGRPVITAEQDPSVVSLFRQEAEKNGSQLYALKRDFDLTTEYVDRRGAVITVYGPARIYRDIHLPVPGAFQVTNAALAVAGLDILAATNKITLTEDTVRGALAGFRFGGRMEIVQERPLTILDGAHNPHKIESLVASLKAAYPAKRITAIVGMMRVKDARAVIQTLAPIVARFIFAAPVVYGKRSFPPDELADIAAQVAPYVETHVVERVQDSVEYALHIVNPDDLLLVTGSIYLVGEARDHWFPAETILTQLALQPAAQESRLESFSNL